MDWIKFKRSLTQGTKRALSRATRFIYCELALAALDLEGDIELPVDGDIVEVVHDLLGGDRKEIAAALPRLMAAPGGDDPMIRISTEPARRVLRIVAWDRHVRVDHSTERVREWRKKRGIAPDETSRNGDETRFNPVSGVSGNGDGTPLPENVTPREERREEKRSEEKREGERAPTPVAENETSETSTAPSPLKTCAEWIAVRVRGSRWSADADPKLVTNVSRELAPVVTDPELDEDLAADAVDAAVDKVSQEIENGKAYTPNAAVLQFKHLARLKLGDVRIKSRERRDRARVQGTKPNQLDPVSASDRRDRSLKLIREGKS